MYMNNQTSYETSCLGSNTLKTLHSGKVWMMGLSLILIGLGTSGPGSALANPDNQNSSYVQNVELEDTPAVINLTLENTSANKHIGQLKIEPTTSNINLDLEGHVQCDSDLWDPEDEVVKPEQISSNAYVYWGTVHLNGNAVIPTETLYDASYEPLWWVFSLIGVDEWWSFPIWEANKEPFQVPLTAIKDGSADIRFRPVEVFNQIFDQWVQDSGGSRVQYLKQDHYFTVMRPISLSGYCRDGGTQEVGGGYDTILMPIHVKYIGDPELQSDPWGESELPDGEAVPFQVTAASVKTQFWDENYEGACPTNLDFQVKIETVGQGVMKYRMVNRLGGKSPIYQTWIGNGGVHYDNFSHEVDESGPSPGDGVVDGWANPGAGQNGSIDGEAVPPSDKQFDSWRIEIVSPNAMTSEEHFYYWTCTPQRPKGDRPGGITHPKRPSDPTQTKGRFTFKAR